MGILSPPQGIVPWQCSGHTSATRGTEKILLLMLQVNQSRVGEAQSSSQEMVMPEAFMNGTPKRADETSDIPNTMASGGLKLI